MPQLQLPIFPAGTTEISPQIAVQCRDGKVVYVHGHSPVFQHAANDLPAFRFFTSQLVVNGTARVRDVAATFGLPAGTVKRYVKLCREQGAGGFFRTRRRQRGETKLNEESKQRARQLLEEGLSVAEVGRRLGVLPTTLHKAIRSQRLEWNKKKR